MFWFSIGQTKSCTIENKATKRFLFFCFMHLEDFGNHKTKFQTRKKCSARFFLLFCFVFFLEILSFEKRGAYCDRKLVFFKVKNKTHKIKYAPPNQEHDEESIFFTFMTFLCKCFENKINKTKKNILAFLPR